MSGTATVNITITGSPPVISYSPATVTASSAMDIIYTVTTSGWSIVGVGKADQMAHENLCHGSTALPMSYTPENSDPINCLLALTPTSSITISNSMNPAEDPYDCSFSLVFSDGTSLLVHDPQVTNDPG